MQNKTHFAGLRSLKIRLSGFPSDTTASKSQTTPEVGAMAAIMIIVGSWPS